MTLVLLTAMATTPPCIRMALCALEGGGEAEMIAAIR